MTLEHIEEQARQMALQLDALDAMVRSYEQTIAKIRDRKLPFLKAAARALATERARLEEMIRSAPDLFTRPKTQVLHGIKVGFQKNKGSITWDDADAVVHRIRKHYPPKVAEGLLHITERPDKKALENLEASALKRLGVTVEEAGEKIVIRPMDSEVEKLVDSIIKSAVEGVGDTAQQEAA